MTSIGSGAPRLPRRSGSRPSDAAAQHSLPLQQRRRLSLSRKQRIEQFLSDPGSLSPTSAAPYPTTAAPFPTPIAPTRSSRVEGYKDFVSKANASRTTKGKSDHIPDGAQHTWCADWNIDAAKEVSLKAKKNRLTELDGPVTDQIMQRGGSVSAASYLVAFEEVEQMAMERSQPLPDSTKPPHVDKNAIYPEVATQAAKGCMPFIGSSSWDSTASSHVYVSQACLAELEIQIQMRRVELPELRLLVKQRNEIIERQKQLIEDHAKDAARFQLKWDRIIHRLPPSPPDSPPHS